MKPRDPIPESSTQNDLVLEMIDDFAAALVNMRIYSASHRRVTDLADSVARFVNEITTAGPSHPLRISIANEMLVMDRRPLIGASITASRVIRAIVDRGGGGIEFDANTNSADVLEILGLLSTRVTEGDDWNRVNAQLAERHIRSIRLLPPYVLGAAERAAVNEGILSAPVRFYQTCIDTLQEVTVAICHGGRIEFGPVKTHAEAVLRGLESDEGPLMNLARQDQYDAFTFGHSVRVAVIAMNFARTLTRNHDLLIRIGTAALLHDCGKSLIPFEILHSRKQLGPEERAEMNKHPAFGAEILLDHDNVDPLAVAAAFGHHRACDGGGYPRTRAQHHNLLVTEIVKLCDVYEALTAARPYKRPMSPIRAYRIMISMGDHLDRALLRRFIESNGAYPIGQTVRLASGELARVRHQTDEILQPIVRVISDRNGDPLDAIDTVELDLRYQERDSLRRIDGVLEGAERLL
ncbi:MAG: HD-GYP domain-containing protein [Planctomycetota bacterium]